MYQGLVLNLVKTNIDRLYNPSKYWDPFKGGQIRDRISDIIFKRLEYLSLVLRYVGYIIIW